MVLLQQEPLGVWNIVSRTSHQNFIDGDFNHHVDRVRTVLRQLIGITRSRFMFLSNHSIAAGIGLW